MSNNWGRGGGSSTAVRSGGAGGILFTAVVCLALGGAAGYGAFRLTGGGADSGEIAARDETISDLRREVEVRGKEAQESLRDLEDLRQENDRLAARVETLGSQSVPDPVPAGENRRLAQEATRLEKELKLAAQRIADAEAFRRRAEEAVRERERQLTLSTDQIARLEKTLDQLRGQQSSARDAETERLQAETDALRSALDAANAEADRLKNTDLPALRQEIARKDAEIGELTARIAALEMPSAGGDTATPVRDNGKPDDGRSPRNAALVASALSGTPGLERLSGEQRNRLERTLVSGECVTNALGAVFTRVPILTLRNLMRDLDSDC